MDISKELGLEDLECEVWKDIEGYEKYYQISSLGRVKSLERIVIISGTGKNQFVHTRILKTFKCEKTGYRFNALSKKGYQAKRFSIHRLMAIHFIPNPENKPQVNHINGIKDDNRLENLEWNTASENQIHALKIGLSKGKKGSTNGCAKLTGEQAYEIKYGHKGLTQTQIGNIYGLKFQSISDIRRGKNWPHLTPDRKSISIEQGDGQ